MQIKASVIERNSVPIRASANRLEEVSQYVFTHMLNKLGVQIEQAEYAYLSDNMARILQRLKQTQL